VIQPKLARDWPLASVVVYGDERERAVRILMEDTDYPDVEFLVIEAGDIVGGEAPTARRRAVPARTTLGASLAAAATLAEGHLLAFVAADLEMLTAEWLRELSLDARLVGVACVSPVILTHERQVASAGLTFDAQGRLHPVMAGQDPESDGLAGSLSCAREVSVVDGRCFAVVRPVLEEIGGLDPSIADVRYQAADLSLRALTEGRRNLCTPRVRLLESARPAAESATELDRVLLADAYREILRRGDPLWSGQMQAVLDGGLG
jgi:hypothetical protein